MLLELLLAFQFLPGCHREFAGDETSSRAVFVCVSTQIIGVRRTSMKLVTSSARINALLRRGRHSISFSLLNLPPSAQFTSVFVSSSRWPRLISASLRCHATGPSAPLGYLDFQVRKLLHTAVRSKLQWPIVGANRTPFFKLIRLISIFLCMICQIAFAGRRSLLWRQIRIAFISWRFYMLNLLYHGTNRAHWIRTLIIIVLDIALGCLELLLNSSLVVLNFLVEIAMMPLVMRGRGLEHLSILVSQGLGCSRRALE